MSLTDDIALLSKLKEAMGSCVRSVTTANGRTTEFQSLKDMQALASKLERRIARAQGGASIMTARFNVRAGS